MVRFEIFTISRGGGRTPQTIEATGVVGSFATRAEAETFLKKNRFEIADSETPVGVRPVPTAEEAARVPRLPSGQEIRGPPPSERGRQLRRRRIQRELAEQAQKKASRGEAISAAERAAFRRSRFITESGDIVTGAFIGIQTPEETARITRTRSLSDQLRESTFLFPPPIRETRAEQQARIREATVFLPRMGLDIRDFRGIMPQRTPIQETRALAPLKIDLSPFQRGPRGGTIETGLAGQDIIFGEPAPVFISPEQRKAERRARSLLGEFGLGAALGAEFVGGVAKAKKAVPEAAAFGGLAFFSPVAAGVVGVAATALSVPVIQQEIAQKGVLRTIASELPTLFLFGAAGGAGARLKTSAPVREAAFDIKLEKLSAKDIDPSFTFEKQPFFIETTGKPPAFLQRTLKGKVLTPRQLEFSLSGLRSDIIAPTTPKELRLFLGELEKAPISRQQAAELDIFRPEIEESFLVEPSREGLITPGRLGRKEQQLQLRETFPTTAQKAAFALQQQPKILTPPPRQVSLFDVFRGKKGQAALIPQFDFLDVLRGAGEGLRRFKAPDLPKIFDPVSARTRTGQAFDFSSILATDLFSRQETRAATGTRSISSLVQDVFQIPIQEQQAIQRQETITDLDILQIQKADVLTVQDVFQEQRQEQRQDLITLPIQITEPFTAPFGRIFEPTKPTTKKTKPKRLRGFFLEGGENFITAAEIQGFDVLVREKGKDIEVDKKMSFPRQRANNIGADIVDNSAAASFRIKSSNQPIDSIIDDPFFFKGNKFRSPKTKSKLPPKQFVEKRRFRIDTGGELAGITAKGLIAKRRKQIKQSLIGGIDIGGFEL